MCVFWCQTKFSKPKYFFFCSPGDRLGARWRHKALMSEQGEVWGSVLCHVMQNYHISFMTEDFYDAYVCLQEECQNYIRVLLISGRTLFTCGTNAFTPVCITRQVGTTLYHVTSWSKLPMTSGLSHRDHPPSKLVKCCAELTTYNLKHTLVSMKIPSFKIKEPDGYFHYQFIRQLFFLLINELFRLLNIRK